MPNLRDWIEAQLKRGYNKQQIKSILVRKGYPPEAVAEVDKIGYSSNFKNKKISKHFSYKLAVFIGLIIIVMVAVNYLPGFLKQTQEKSVKLNDAGGETAMQLTKNALKSDYWPESFSFSSVQKPNSTEIIYAANWKIGDTAFVETYALGDNNIGFVAISVQLPEMNIEEHAASDLANKYFSGVKNSFYCKTNTACEEFWTDDNGKRGIILSRVKTPSGNMTLLNACLIPAGSKYYGRDSCRGL